MLKYKRHKKFVQAMAFAFALQCVGGSFTPVITYAADATSSSATDAKKTAVAEAEIKYTVAKVSEETIKAALGEIIELKDEDDDVQYVNKVYQLMTDSTGKTSQYDNLKALITAAESEKAEADASGASISENAQAILNMAERLSKITSEAADGSSAYTDAMKNNDIKIYTATVSELKTCNAKANVDKANDKTPTACAMTDAQKAAYQRLISNNAIVEAFKKATQQVNQTSSTPTSTNAIDAQSSSSSGSSSSTTTTKNLSCYDGTVLSGDGKCCPTATPIYDKDSGVCVTGIATESKKSSSSDSGDKNAMLLALLGVGAVGGGKDSNSSESQNTENKNIKPSNIGNNQYSFNYSIQQDEKGSPITFLPANSDDIKFIVFKSEPMIKVYDAVLSRAKQSGKANNTKKIAVNESISIKVPTVFGMNDNNPSVVHYIEVPLEFGKWKDLFKDDLKANVQWNYQNYTNMLRVPATSFNSTWKYYSATVVYKVNDNFGHSQSYQFYVPFDFMTTETRIGAAIDTKRSDIEIPSIKADDKSYISVEGTVAESKWNNGKCTININGTAVDDKSQEIQEDVTLPYTTYKLTKAECSNLSKGTKVVVSGSGIESSSLSGGVLYSDKLGAIGNISENGVSTDNTVTINGKDVNGLYYVIDKTTGTLVLTDESGNAWTQNNTDFLNKYTQNNATDYQMCNNYQGDTDICAVYADDRREKINSNAYAKQSMNNAYIAEKENFGKRINGVVGGTLGELRNISTNIQQVSNNNANPIEAGLTTLQGIAGAIKNGLSFNGLHININEINIFEETKNSIDSISLFSDKNKDFSAFGQ